MLSCVDAQEKEDDSHNFKEKTLERDWVLCEGERRLDVLALWEERSCWF